MTFTPRRITETIARDLSVEPAPAAFDPCSGVHFDFEASRIRKRLDEAEQLNRCEIRTAEAVTMPAEPDRTAEVSYLIARVKAATPRPKQANGWIGPIVLMLGGCAAAIFVAIQIAG